MQKKLTQNPRMQVGSGLYKTKDMQIATTVFLGVLIIAALVVIAEYVRNRFKF